jgi:serine protease inhibitor
MTTSTSTGGPLKVDTLFLLTHAIYCKGQWAQEFDEADTTDGPFQAPSGEQMVKVMHATLRTTSQQGDGYHRAGTLAHSG